jgi:hypothetical protein
VDLRLITALAALVVTRGTRTTPVDHDDTPAGT